MAAASTDSLVGGVDGVGALGSGSFSSGGVLFSGGIVSCFAGFGLRTAKVVAHWLHEIRRNSPGSSFFSSA